MKYQRGQQSYTGFQRLIRAQLIAGSMLVIAWFDGEPDLWMVEDMIGIENLRRYYRDDWGDRVIPFDVFVVHSTDRTLGIVEQFIKS